SRAIVFTRRHGGCRASGAAGLVCGCFGCWSQFVFRFVVSISIDSQRYLGCHPVKVIQWLSAAARPSHPAHGLIPIAEVARLMTSPRLTSFSVTKPGRRT